MYNELFFFSFGLVMKICFIDNNLWIKLYCLCILFVICIIMIFFFLNYFLGKYVYVNYLEMIMVNLI